MAPGPGRCERSHGRQHHSGRNPAELSLRRQKFDPSRRNKADVYSVDISGSHDCSNCNFLMVLISYRGRSPSKPQTVEAAALWEVALLHYGQD